MTTYTMLHDVPAVMAAIGRGEPVQVSRRDGSWSEPLESAAGFLVESALDGGFQFRIASPSRQAMGSQVVSDEMTLARFGHHPDPANDFCIEVESLQSRLFNARHGLSKMLTEPESVAAVLEAIQRAMTFRVGGDEIAVSAKSILRELEREAAASALLARSPCAQGHGDEAMLSWSGFNVHGDAASIAEVKRTVHNCGQFDAGFRHPAPTSAPASTHAAQAPVKELPAWPTREWCDLTDADFVQLRIDMPNVTAGIHETKLRMIGSWFVERLTAAGGRDGEGS